MVELHRTHLRFFKKVALFTLPREVTKNVSDCVLKVWVNTATTNVPICSAGLKCWVIVDINIEPCCCHGGTTEDKRGGVGREVGALDGLGEGLGVHLSLIHI